MRWVLGGRLRQRADVTLAEALHGIRNPELRAILGARGGDYGLPPSQAPLRPRPMPMPQPKAAIPMPRAAARQV